MAIKITGTTVINDERKFENIVQFNRFVSKPIINGLDDVSGLELKGNSYQSVYDSDVRDYREFQIDLSTGDFSTPERSNQVNSDSWVINPELNPNTSYKARIRDVSVNAVISNWSEEIEFTTGDASIAQPTISVEGASSSVPQNPTVTTSTFQTTVGTDTHESTDWQVFRVSDNELVFQSLRDTENLESILVTTDLDESEQYEFRARHLGTSSFISTFGSATATTLASFGPTTLGEAYEGGFYMGTISSTHYLVVAPVASGSGSYQWKTESTLTGDTDSSFNGFNNTYPALANTTHPAGNFAAAATIGGYDDWYLPASDELIVLYENGGGTVSDPLPAGEEIASNEHWSSTEFDTSFAETFDFNIGTPNIKSDKTINYCVRVIRRVPI